MRTLLGIGAVSSPRSPPGVDSIDCCRVLSVATTTTEWPGGSSIITDFSAMILSRNLNDIILAATHQQHRVSPHPRHAGTCAGAACGFSCVRACCGPAPPGAGLWLHVVTQARSRTTRAAVPVPAFTEQTLLPHRGSNGSRWP